MGTYIVDVGDGKGSKRRSIFFTHGCCWWDKERDKETIDGIQELFSEGTVHDN